MTKQNRIVSLIAATIFFAALFMVLANYQQTIADFVFARRDQVTAALTGVTLNNGTTNIALGTDVTSQATALSPDFGAYTWTANGTNFLSHSIPGDNGGTATDLSGYGQNMTIVGASHATGCKVGGCFSFDGVDDHLKLNLPATIKTANITMEAWVNLDATGSTRMIVAGEPRQANAVGLGAHLAVNASGNAYFTKGTGFAFVAVVGTSTLSTGTWYHLVGTFNGSTMAIYVNGALENTNADATAISWTDGGGGNYPDPAQLYIGAWKSNVIGAGATIPDQFFTDGLIDEVRIYPRALSAAQILQNYNDGNSGLGGPIIIQSEETVVEQLWNLTVTPITSLGSVGSGIVSSNQTFVMGAGSTLTGSLGAMREDIDLDASITVPSGSIAGLQWKLNGAPWASVSLPFNSGASQTDIGGNNYSVTTQGNAAYTSSGCKVGGCLALDGADDYAILNSTAPFASLSALTISTWVNSSTSAVIIANHFGCVDWESVWLSTSQFILNSSNAGGTRATLNYTSVADSQWHHVVALWTGTQMYAYVDGSLSAGPLAQSVQPWANTRSPHIGAFQDNCSPPAGSEINGKIDEFQIYRRALSASEILQLYQDGVGSSASASDGDGAPVTISFNDHAYNQAWQLFAYEFFNTTGTIGGPIYVGSGTIGAAATTTITPTTPSGTQSRDITITYTCGNADNTARDFLVQYSVNGGGAFSNATLVSASSGTVSGSTIYGATCNGSSQTLVWDSVSDLVASGVLDSDVRIRLTAQINAAPSGSTGNFSVQNPTIFSSPTTISDGTYDGTDILCAGTTLTINGTHTYASLDLRNGCVLTHSTNTTTQTNTLNLTITGNVTVSATSSINLNGKGYQGGVVCNTAGSGPGGGPLGTNPGSGEQFGQGGASYGGRGGSGNNTNVSASYGSMSAPNELGSGGAGGGWYNCSGSSTAGGSGGGLLILNVSGTLTLNGTISSNGNAGTSNNTNAVAGGGSGGGINITAGTVTGAGTISANGGNASNTTGSPNYGYGGAGGGGRIAVYFTTNTHSNLSGSVFAYGGPFYNAGSAGTIYLKPAGDNFGDLVMTNNNVAGQYTTIISGVTQFDTITISNAANVVYSPASLELDETLTIGGTASTRFALGGTAFTSATGTADIIVNNNGILSHDFNTTTRANYIDISGIQDVTVNSGGSINVDGRGYRGGITRCAAGAGPGAGQPGTDPGSGSNFHSGGASHGGRGGTGNNSSVAAGYGSPTAPIELGSGGAGGGDYGCDGQTTNGGAGGGAIKILGTGTLTINGTITTNGVVGVGLGGGGAGGGAGGSVWLNFATVAGSSTISANGANSTESGAGSGGGGRVAVYYTTNSHASLSTSTTARGGSLANAGGAGSIYFKPSGDNFGDLQFSNGGTAGQYTTLFTGVTQVDTLTVSDAAYIIYQPTTLEVDELITIGGTASTTFAVSNTAVSSSTGVADIVVNNNGVLSHDTNTTTQVNDLEVTGFRHATINGGGSISVLGKGFSGGSRCSDGSGAGGGKAGPDPGSGSNFPGGGGTYGGRGGNGQSANYANFYGSITAPALLGSGGAGGGDYGCDGPASTGGAGGGFLKMVLSGTLTLNGSINANGGLGISGSGQSGGGSGGSIWLDVDTITGSGTISADGGNPSSAGGGAGGGGRIAIYYDTNTHAGLIAAISVAGGSVSNYGSSGTAFVKDNALSNGDLKVDNNNFVSTHFTNLFVTGQPATYTFRDLYVIEQAKLLIDTPCSGTPALTVTGATYLTSSGTITNNQPGTCTVSQTAINITTTSLPGAVLGQAYSQTVVASGGYAPYTWVCRNGGLTVACITVLPTGLDMNSSGVISGTPTVAGTYPFTVRATESSPGVGTDEQLLSISVGNAPSAPTSLFTHNTNAQLGNSNPSGIDASPVFSAIYNDADTGETATKYRVQVASDAGFTTLLWDSGAAGTALSVACNQGFRCANINYAGSALSLNATTYYWRIKFWDQLDIEGAFSATNQFVTDTAPTAPTNLFSNDSNAQTGLTNPVGVLAAHPVFSAIYNDPDIGDIATKYRVQVDDNSNFSSVVWDSGAAGTSMANCNQGARCADIVFAGADLAADEKIYYWRIKFWDQAGAESLWSQDPLSTNTFQMGLGGSSQQRIQQQQQQDQQLLEQNSAPSAPIAGAVEVLDAHTLRYNWIDTSSNETGFKILDASGQVLVDIQTADTNRTTETNLPSNAVVQGRKVLAYNSIGESAASDFASATTAAEPVQPVLRNRGINSVTFAIQPAIGTFVLQTAVRFEVIAISPVTGQTRTLTSEWIQSNEYTFDGIAENESVQVRAYARNQLAIATEPSTYQDIEGISRQFFVTLVVFKKGTNILPRPLQTSDALAVSIQIQNVGTETATNVLVALPLPQYLLYRVGSLTVNGRIQSDAADQDVGQANGNAISAIWAQVAANETHTLTFELIFDEPALDLLRPQIAGDVGRVQATANPIINLQAAVSFAESDQVFASPVISIEPDITTPQQETVLPIPPEPTPEEPVALPTPEEVQQINEFLNQIIQQEVAEIGGDQGLTPSIPQGEPTNVSSDGPSFNLQATNEAGETLSLTGSAKPDDDQIQFTGTTSQPFTLVTLIFNNSVTAIVVSDANGNWHTFVSAEQLGIKQGQESTVKIEAIASKGDLRSERVQVGEVRISLGRSGDIDAEFDTTVSSNNVVTAINEVRKEVVRVIEAQQPVIQTTLSVTAPIVVVSSVPLWGYLPYVPTMIYHFITYLLGLIGRKKKGQQRFYGVVYDSITKQPLPLAIVRIYSSTIPAVVIPPSALRLRLEETGGEAVAEARPELVEGGSLSQVRKLISTTVTDKLGRYEALLAPGKYKLEVTKPTYQFPSQIVTTEVDANFHTYKAQDGMTIGEQGTEITVPDVPLDPVNAQRQWQLTGGVKKVWLAIQKVGNYLAVPVLLVGSIASVVTVAAVPDNGVNWLLAIMYVLLLAAQLRLRPKIVKAWGVVYDIATNAVLPLTTIQLIDPSYGKVVTSRLSDYEGRFSFLPEPGTYVIKASKPGYAQISEVAEAPQTNRQPMRGEITIDKADQRINGDIAMRQDS